MKNMEKRGLAILLIFAMLLGLPSLIISVSAASGETMDLYMDTVTAMPENTVQITIELKNNPGLASLKFNVVYDSYLTLEDVTFDQAFGAYVLAPTPYKNPQTLSFISPLEEVNANGTFATLIFRISDNAPDNYMAEIRVDCDEENVFDGDLSPVGVNVHNGAVNIIHGIPGDIDGDRKVNNKDAIMLFRYVAGWDVTVDEAALDVNCDGSVNNKDAITLFRYVAGWDVEIGRGSSSAVCAHRKAEKIPAVLPTCTENGYSEGGKCIDCGKVIDEPVVLPAVGHDYVNGVCTRCADEDESYNPDTPNYKKIVLGGQLSNSSSFDPFCWDKTKFGQRFNTNEDVLSQIFIANLATYSDGNINTWSLKVWRWNGVYENTVAEEPLYLLLGENHVDNASFLAEIPTELGIKGDIYYELEYLSGSKFFTSWEADPVEGVEVYLEGERTRTNYKAYASVVSADTDEPDAPEPPNEPERPEPPASGNYNIPMDRWSVTGHKPGITSWTDIEHGSMVSAGMLDNGALLHQGAIGVGELDLSKYSHVILYCGCDNSYVTQEHYANSLNNRIILTTADTNGMDFPLEENIIAATTYTLHGWVPEAVVIDLSDIDYSGPVYITYDTLPGTFMLFSEIEFVEENA